MLHPFVRRSLFFPFAAEPRKTDQSNIPLLIPLSPPIKLKLHPPPSEQGGRREVVSFLSDNTRGKNPCKFLLERKTKYYGGMRQLFFINFFRCSKSSQSAMRKGKKKANKGKKEGRGETDLIYPLLVLSPPSPKSQRAHTTTLEI